MLAATLAASPSDGVVTFTLSVENTGDDDAVLRFSDAQRADFTAFDDGEVVWRWGDDRAFAQLMGEETVPSGETVAYEATWSNPPSGEYRVVGELTARNHDATAETVVEV